MSEHTAGPWSYSEQRGSKNHCTVAQVWDSYGDCLAIIESTDDEAVATANARLIAAAPELLAALEEIRSDPDIQYRVWIKADKAIKKARGE
jgi:hypothetical protein